MCCDKSYGRGSTRFLECKRSCKDFEAVTESDDKSSQCVSASGQSNIEANCSSRNSDKDSTLSATTCKKDYCILCCNTSGIMQGKSLSTKFLSKCMMKCSEKFNDTK